MSLCMRKMQGVTVVGILPYEENASLHHYCIQGDRA
jgi:hypothetical protein